MKILVADDHSSFQDLVVSSIAAQRDYEIIRADDGAQALELALLPPRPDVLILDWIMPKLTGTQVCRLVRGTNIHPQPYILFLTVRCRREELLRCMAAGADDLLTKPFAPDVLLARIDLAARRTTSTHGDASIDDALREAQKEGDGELVIRSGQLKARVLVCGGKIAWVQLADSFGTLLDAMGSEVGMDAEAAQAIVAECRSTGRGLGETLSSWGFVQAEQLREIARHWLRKKIGSLRDLEQPRFLFLPGKQRCSKELLFDLEELLDEHEPLSLLTPSVLGQFHESATPSPRPSIIPNAGWGAAFQMSNEPEPGISAILTRAMQGDGVLGVVAVDRTTGSCLGRQGNELNPDIVWAHLQMINAIMQNELVQDAHIGTDRHLHLATVLPHRDRAVVYALIDRNKVSVAAARLSLQAALGAGLP